LAAIAVISLVGVTAVSAETNRTSACAKGYFPCLPVRADLDCDESADSLKPVRVTGADPYGLNRDRDGLGCEVAGEGGGARSPWGLILRKPPRKEATSAKVGDTLTVVGWSPRSMKGETYQLCYQRGQVKACILAGKTLTGRVQTFGLWRVMRGQAVRGVLKVSLVVLGRSRAFDTVPVR
jgi:hypothetical protein